MEVHFTPEQEAQNARFQAVVREGIAQADRGEFVEESEMDVRFEELLQS